MIPEVVRKYTVPRMLYTSVVVPAGEEVRVDPDAFSNPTKYRMKLVALVFGSPNPTVPVTGRQGLGIPNIHPLWTNHLLIDVGKSNCGDMNLVSATATSLCGNLRRIRSIGGGSNMARNWRLPTPYLLPRDEGLRVSVEWIKPQYSYTIPGEVSHVVPVGPFESGEVTFIAKGYKPDGYPAMLAGRCDSFSSDNRGNATLMNSADLFNNGKEEIYITEFIYKEIDRYYYMDGLTEEWFFSGNGCNFAWQVNPTNPTFTQFMPQPRHIPTALLTPMCRSGDGGQESPVAYFFPKDTWLDPKQALGIRLGNTANGISTSFAIDVHISLLGELEVR